MNHLKQLSRSRLKDFLACQRRFQLRYLQQVVWPTPPLTEAASLAQQRGQVFHRLLERFFLGMTINESDLADDVLRSWWRMFQRNYKQWPEAQLLPELDLTVPIDGYLISGRFDLLVLGHMKAHIFDWKTGRPQSMAFLRQTWQTRLYLAMLAQSGTALGQNLEPDHLSITYWYVQDPFNPQTIGYSQTEHKRNWTEIRAVIAQIDQQLTKDEWPLTTDRSQCRICLYQTYCGRQDAGPAITLPVENEEPMNISALLSTEPLMP